MSDECVFCRIIAGRSSAHIVHRDEHTLSILDTKPLFHGHTLVMPLDHHVTLGELPDDLLHPLFATAQRLSRVMEGCLDAAGSFVAMNNRISQSVPHLHVHVVPRNPKDGLRGFFWPRTKYESESQVAEVAQRLAEAMAQV